MPLLSSLSFGLALLQAQALDALKAYPLPIRLSVSFPSKPTLKTSPDGMKVYVCVADKSAFVVASQKLEAGPGQGTPDQQLAASVIGMLQSITGKLGTYKDRLLDGWPGVEFSVKGEELSSLGRHFMVDGNLVMIGVTYSTNLGMPSYANKVLDSLVLAEGTKAGPETNPDLPFKPLAAEGVRFAVDFPGDPKDEPKDLGKEGEGVTLHQFHYQRDLREFTFAYATVPEEAGVNDAESQKQLREFIANDVLDAMHPQSRVMKTVTRDGKEWTTCFVRFADFASGRLDVVFADSRVYALLSGGPDPWAKSPAFNRFFDSFKLTN